MSGHSFSDLSRRLTWKSQFPSSLVHFASLLSNFGQFATFKFQFEILTDFEVRYRIFAIIL